MQGVGVGVGVGGPIIKVKARRTQQGSEHKEYREREREREREKKTETLLGGNTAVLPQAAPKVPSLREIQAEEERKRSLPHQQSKREDGSSAGFGGPSATAWSHRLFGPNAAMPTASAVVAAPVAPVVAAPVVAPTVVVPAQVKPSMPVTVTEPLFWETPNMVTETKAVEAPTSIFGGPLPSPELERWSLEQLRPLTKADVDSSLIHFLMTVADPLEVRDYVMQTLNVRQGLSAFVDEFVRRRRFELPTAAKSDGSKEQRPLATGGNAGATSSEANRKRGGKKSKKHAVN